MERCFFPVACPVLFIWAQDEGLVWKFWAPQKTIRDFPLQKLSLIMMHSLPDFNRLLFQPFFGEPCAAYFETSVVSENGTKGHLSRAGAPWWTFGRSRSVSGVCLVGDLAYFPNRKSTMTGESIKWNIVNIWIIFWGPRISKSKVCMAANENAWNSIRSTSDQNRLDPVFFFVCCQRTGELGVGGHDGFLIFIVTLW